MLKILTILIAALANLSCVTVTNNFYAGLNFGANHMSGLRNDSATNVNEDTKNFNVNKRCRATSGLGGVLAGYLLRLDNFGIGPEFFYNYGKIEAKSTGSFYDNIGSYALNYNIKNKLSGMYGLNFRFGYFIDSYFVYGLIGSNQLKQRCEVVARKVEAGGNSDRKFKKNNKARRLSLGFGTQKSINEFVDLGLEYKIARFPVKKYTFSHNDIDQNVYKSDFKYKLHTVSVRLIYKF